MTTQLSKPKPLSPAQQDLRAKCMLIWRHNSFLVHCQMARMNMLNIANSETATDEAKDLAENIASLVNELCALLEKHR